MNKLQQAATNLLNRGEITQEEYQSMEKVGVSWNEFTKTTFFKEVSARPILTALGLAGLAAATKELVVDPLVMNAKVNKSFETMTQKVPQLAEKDQDQIRDYFDVIKTYSPRAASNPLVAGALVNKMMEFGGVDHKLVQDIADIEASKGGTVITEKMIDAASKAGFNSLLSASAKALTT